MNGEQSTPAERILRLAAYAKDKRGAPITLSDIVDDVPGYETDAERNRHGDLVTGTAEWEAIRKRLTRDITDLREHWGISLDYDDAEHCYRLRAPFFTVDERAALLAAAATVSIEGVPVARPGDLGAAVDDTSALVVVRLHDLVAELRDAIGTRTPVSFRHDGRERHVEPYALGMWRNRWYLAARDADSDAVRRYRLDRIEEHDGTSIARDGDTGAYEIPADFDAATAFDLDPNVWGDDPCVRAHVRVSRDHVGAFLAELGGETTGEDGDDAIVELDVRQYASFRTRLLSFRGNAVVLAPPELVAAVRDHLAHLAGVQ